MSKSFENNFKDFNSLSTDNNVLNSSYDGISDKFMHKLHGYIVSKETMLHSTMESDIFYDNTIYTGSAGVALYYLMQALKNPDNVEKLKKSLSYIDIENLKGKRISFVCGDAGPLAIASVISYRMGSKRPTNLPDYKVLTQRLMSLISLLNESPDEILYGKAGYLYALLFVNRNINGKEAIPPSFIEKVINAILKSGKKFSQKMNSPSPLLWEWHNKIYFGGAHGMAGILYILLQAHLYTNVVEIRTYIKPTLDWLLSQQFPSGNYPSSLDSATGDKLVQWCHGAPGFVPLCILASQIFADEKYLKIALKLGDVVWDRGICVKGYSLCHGVGGNTYTFIQLYQVTKNPMYLYRACCFMEWCAVERPCTELHHPDRPASLFEGLVGRLYLAQDIRNVNDAKFPGYTL